MEAQLSLFSTIQSIKDKEVKDIRTEVQKNRSVSYDVGEKVGLARKDLHMLKKTFFESISINSNLNSVDTLHEIEENSRSLAFDLVNKHILFDSFSLQAEKENSVLPSVAKFKQLIINRIASHPADSSKSRQAFVLATEKLLDRYSEIRDWDQMEDFISSMNIQLKYENNTGESTQIRIEELEEMLFSYQTNSDEIDPKRVTYIRNQLVIARKRLSEIQKANQHNYGVLGDKFRSLFTKQASLNSSLKTAQKVKEWDDLLQPKKKSTVKKTTKPVWERELPERPDRVGGRPTSVKKPEDMVSVFKFKGVEFGHWVEDQKAMEHIYRCSEAFMDLADVLGVQESKLAMNELALGFGSRGRGKALGHFERANKVINFTKEKGTLGVAAHEYAHFLDCMLYCSSHSYQSGKIEYLSELSYGAAIPTVLVACMMDLMNEIKEGSSTAFFPNTNKPETSWRIGSSLKTAYVNCNGDFMGIMKKKKSQLDDSLKRHLSMVTYYSGRDTQIEKLKKRQFRDLKKYAQALAWYHEQETGVRVERIPYPADHSEFLQSSISLDRGKLGKYWSSDCELFARCFEAWVEDQLISQNRSSDYLVCGTKDSLAYPVGEEREKINKCMDALMKEVKMYLF
ncbi:LPD1 domain-containing protein [Rossellomorea sp. NPDC071047]|uniref:LPD1 domain-containing protein n=1 Tax=Rossellomorea sp. NPDC071047 TaxID=3390675 RepID=UPI003CFDA153